MLYKRLKQRGAVLTEYIIILAYIAAIASSFTSDNGIVDAAKAAAAIAKEDIIVALGGERPSKNNPNIQVMDNAQKWEGLLNDLYFKLMEQNPKPDEILQYIKISGNKGDGTCTLEYKFEGDTKRVTVSGNGILFNVDGKDYQLGSESFIHINADGTFNKGWDVMPTRIIIREQGSDKDYAAIGFNEAEQKFFDNVKYFPNNGSINN